MEPINTIIIAIITSFVIGTLIAFHEATNMLEKRCVETSCGNTRDTFNMALVSQGIDPQFINEKLLQFSLITSSAKRQALKTSDGKSAINQIHCESHSGEIAVGFSVNINNPLAYTIHSSKLNPPDILISGELKDDWIPLKNIILPAKENPSGTFFRYTIDGSDPTVDSPVWENEGFLVEDIPSKIKFVSFHADPIYKPSEVTSAEFSFPVPIIQVTREKGGNSLGVSFSEISTNTNRILLETENHPALFKISYKIGSSSDWKPYDGPFHIPLDFWSKEGVELSIRAEPKATAITFMTTKTVRLTPSKEKLKAPIFSPRSESNLISKKDTITVDKNNTQGELRVSIDGYPDANSPSTSSIAVSL